MHGKWWAILWILGACLPGRCDDRVGSVPEENAPPTGFAEIVVAGTESLDSKRVASDDSKHPEDALSVSLFGPGIVSTGADARYEIRVVHRGPAPLGTVEVRVRIPESLVDLRSEPAARREGDLLLWSLSQLSPDEMRTIVLHGSVREEGMVTLDVSARVSLTTSTSVVSGDPELSVRLTEPASVAVGGPIDLTAVVTNVGPVPVSNGGLQVLLSEGLRMRRTGAERRAPFRLSPGESLSIPLNLTADISGVQGVKVQIKADDAPAVESEAEFVVHGGTLSVELDGLDAPGIGSPVTYRLFVANRGDRTCERTVGFIELDRSMDFVSADANGVFDPRQHLVYWSIGDLPPGMRVRLELRARRRRDGFGELRGSAKERHGAIGEAYLDLRPHRTESEAPAVIESAGGSRATRAAGN